MSTNVICEAKLKLNNESDERGYITLDEIEETSIVYCDDCDSNKIRKREERYIYSLKMESENE
tara:strand:+ start:378 stop:566 length:189 start_codon:yes stop_codon:yes gene_type:complete